MERLLSDGFEEFAEDIGAGQLCEDDLDCAAEHICHQGTCVGTGELRISLSWHEVTDLDLHVLTPDGTEISYLNPRVSFAALDVDDCVAASCRRPEGPHVENVVFESHAPRGTYQVWVENFDGRHGSDWEIVVMGDVTAYHSGDLPNVQGAQSDPFDVVWED